MTADTLVPADLDCGPRPGRATGEIDTIGVCHGRNPHHVDLTCGAHAPLSWIPTPMPGPSAGIREVVA